ncbi:hypothetical protein AVEN_114750-1 [Araneus ventricosus]|uniref:Uncharacterized protein n=1 Tax=Araneus ventricosus TaxID=182803 RepID=A0A4Y2U8L0_ARAVE|nr:hypothetical protein AVEN_114750-1 [Araneus ventricosus]
MTVFMYEEGRYANLERFEKPVITVVKSFLTIPLEKKRTSFTDELFNQKGSNLSTTLREYQNLKRLQKGPFQKVVQGGEWKRLSNENAEEAAFAVVEVLTFFDKCSSGVTRFVSPLVYSTKGSSIYCNVVSKQDPRCASAETCRFREAHSIC